MSLLLNHYRPVSTLAFCNTKQQCRDLVQVLRAQGFAALALHGDLEQRDRDQVLVRFANRSCSVLVATDIAARGLDIAQLEAVINVDITPDPATHIAPHRPHRPRRRRRLGLQPGQHGRDGPRRPASSRPRGFTLGVAAAGRADADQQRAAARRRWRTLQILGGRKEKIRPGDVLGALTKDLGFDAAQIGKINVNEFSTYVAVRARHRGAGCCASWPGKVKGRSVKVRLLED